ncbi:MAG: ComF family protein [Methylococcales bacterium]|jgi:ComF family protein
MLHNWINIIQDYLLPPTCILCGNPGFNSRDLCEHCYQRLARNRDCCYRCAERFSVPIITPQLCGKCLSSPPAFDETLAPFVYQGEMRHLITTLKYGTQTKNARLLGLLLTDYLKENAQLPELIIPVPLHKVRYRERGFNQTIEIATTLSKTLNIPLNSSACIRTENTPHQVALNAQQRQINITNAFKIIKPINVQHIAIVDDVMTTGATVNELANELKKTGVSRIDIWACAKA